MKDNVDFKFEDGSNVFFTSDTHWGHVNILEFCNRPYKNVEEMNYRLIDNWNKKVPADGLVFHLGDFAWGGYPFWKNIRDQLNGKIILIKGNHDEKNLTATGAQELFEHVAYQMKIRVEGRAIYLNHNPFLCYGGTYRDPKGLVYQAFGHVHSGPGAKGLDVERLGVLFPTQYDVGVDNNNYEPISWAEFNEKIGKQLLKSKFKQK